MTKTDLNSTKAKLESKRIICICILGWFSIFLLTDTTFKYTPNWTFLVVAPIVLLAAFNLRKVEMDLKFLRNTEKTKKQV